MLTAIKVLKIRTMLQFRADNGQNYLQEQVKEEEALPRKFLLIRQTFLSNHIWLKEKSNIDGRFKFFQPSFFSFDREWSGPRSLFRSSCSQSCSATVARSTPGIMTCLEIFSMVQVILTNNKMCISDHTYPFDPFLFIAPIDAIAYKSLYTVCLLDILQRLPIMRLNQVSFHLAVCWIFSGTVLMFALILSIFHLYIRVFQSKSITSDWIFGEIWIVKWAAWLMLKYVLLL